MSQYDSVNRDEWDAIMAYHLLLLIVRISLGLLFELGCLGCPKAIRSNHCCAAFLTRVVGRGLPPPLEEIAQHLERGVTYVVVVYSYTNAWWVQPEAAHPYTGIQDGVWDATIHTGKPSSALLVDKKKADASAKDHAYVPPSQTPVLPADDFILASDIVNGARQAANSKGVPVAKHE